MESCILTILGGTATAVIIMLGGEKVKKMLNGKPSKKKKKVFSKKNRMIVKVWKKNGVMGIAFLTPILLSPIGGPLIASVLGAPPWKTIRYIFISGLFWGPVTTAAVYGLFDFVKELFWLSIILSTFVALLGLNKRLIFANSFMLAA